MGENCCNVKCGMIACFVVGAILVILGGILVPVFNLLFVEVTKQETMLAEGTTAFEAWEVVPAPVYMSYYFYNITNADAFLSNFNGATKPDPPVKPYLEEIGPYTFREYLSKDNIRFLTDLKPEQVYYRQKVTYIFEPEMSVGPLDDMITTVNIIGVSIPWIAEYNNIDFNIVDTLLNGLYQLTGTDLLFTHTVQDLLFGIDDPLLKVFSNLTNTSITLGLFSTSNTSDGWFTYQVYTGRKYPEFTSLITTYEEQKQLDYWYGPTCNLINGTDGTSTPPFMKKEDNVFLFVDDICRSLYAVYEQEVTVKNVPAWKYIIPPEIFEAPAKNKNNYCFCPDLENEPLCQYNGAVTLASCQAGTPVFVSSPHFLYGDEYYMKQTEGLSPPNKEEHETALVFEPNSGITLKADKRIQISFLLRHKEGINMFEQIDDDIIIPVVWLNESAIVGQEDADMLYGLLVVPKNVVNVLYIVFLCVGSVMVAVPVFYVIMLKLGVAKSPSKKRKGSDSSSEAYTNSSMESPDEKGEKPSGSHVTRFTSTSSTTEMLN